MKYLKFIAIPLGVGLTLALISLTVNSSADSVKTHPDEPTKIAVQAEASAPSINLFVTHGHCSLPFAGSLNHLYVGVEGQKNEGNPLESVKIQFAIDAQSFKACHGDEYTAEILTPGLFVDGDRDQLVFESTNVFTMGVDWYQINGKLSIKGVQRDVKFFATGIRNPLKNMTSDLIIEGQVDLSDWGIDYEKIVHGKSNPTPTKWMHLNLKLDLDRYLNTRV